jgi:hypothetical protein
VIQVSKEKFFAVVGPLDIHPRPEREVVIWETPRREVVGRSTPGYLCRGPKEYFLAERWAERASRQLSPG